MLVTIGAGKSRGNRLASTLACNKTAMNRLPRVWLKTQVMMMARAIISAEQIVDMHRSGLCYFGSHAHRHTILTNLPADELALDLHAAGIEGLKRYPHIRIYANGGTARAVQAAFPHRPAWQICPEGQETPTHLGSTHRTC